MRFFPPEAFCILSVVLFSYLSWVVTTDARAKGLSHPLASYPDVYFGGWRDGGSSKSGGGGSGGAAAAA
jgi:hypothetical protein